MKQITKIFRTFMFAAMIGSMAVSFNSCTPTDDPGDPVGKGKISGTVTDDQDVPLAGVTVTARDKNISTTTANDGTYTLEGLPIERIILDFTKTGYQSANVTVQANRFQNNAVSGINASLVDASAKITGVVSDGFNAGAPLSGVTVSTSGGAITTTTGADGKYTIENIAVSAYTLVFSKTGYTSITKEVAKADFGVSKTVTVDVTIGGGDIFTGMTAEKLKSAPKWYYNEYKGGRNAEVYPQWDWAVDYMAAMTFWEKAAWAEEDFGTAIQTRNDLMANDQKNPANLNDFDSYMYGSKKITAENKIMSLRVCTGDAANATNWGVQVADLSATSPAAIKIDGNKTLAKAYPEGDLTDASYQDFHFDLSAYVGKEIAIAVGVYRAQTGDYARKLVIRRMTFASSNITGRNWIGGTDVPGLTDWRLPQETLKSIMPNTKKLFDGISYVGGNRDSYQSAYQDWAKQAKHICLEWSFVPLNKDPETFAGQGFLIKTRGGGAVNLNVPEAYIYAKFDITSANDLMKVYCRTFNSTNRTFVKFTVVDVAAMTSKFHLPTANSYAKGAVGIIDKTSTPNFIEYLSEGGDGEGAKDGYGMLEYNLSEYVGKTVVVVIGVHNGTVNGDENKLCFYSIELE